MSALHHILAADPGEPSPVPIHTPPTHLSPQATSSVPLAATNPSNLYPRAILGANDEHMAETPNRKSDDGVGEPAPASSKRNTNSNGGGLSLGVGTNVSSVYSGNKIKHLKKEDGIPLWRKDIQYDFLCHVFYDKTPCFTKYSDDTKGHTFAEVYVDAMAKSSKTSKILKEKLLQDQEGAISMAMVCLLVNVGRMNTTLNCMLARLSFLVRNCQVLTSFQSSPKCAHSYAHTIRYQHCRPSRTRIRTNNFKMHRA